jgi:hypothetical protein
VAPSAVAPSAEARRALCGWCRRSGRDKAFVDFQNDVTAADIRLARAARACVRSSTSSATPRPGMGTDQGKTANVNALAILSDAVGQRIVETGTTTFRPPYTPVAYGAMAGADREHSDPVRVTPIHAWHAAHGASSRTCGQWKRPRFYSRDRRGHGCCRRARVPRGAHVGQRFSMLDPRQDRHSRARRGGVPRSRLHQRLG